MSGPAKVRYFVRTALGSMVRSPFVHVIAIAALALALFGYGVARIASTQLEALLHSLGGEVEFTVYLADDAPPDKLDELEQALVARTHGTAKRVSPSEALGRLAAQLGEQGKALTELGDNPLPWSLEVRLPAEARDADALKALSENVKRLPFVTGVDYGEEAIARLSLIARALRLAIVIAFALVFLTTVIIVSATLQLAIFARRDEIEIQKLVGGTDTFVRFPFLIEGVLQGLLGGGLAVGLAWLGVRALENDPSSPIAFLRLSGHFAVDWPRLAGEMLGLATALGLTGSFVAVRRFLRV
jgi:cell division transport system permease protein